MNTSLCRLVSQRNTLFTALQARLFSVSATKPRAPKSSKWSRDPVEEAKATLPKRVWPKPSEVSFQPKLGNLVSLTGLVQSPVRLETTSDGSNWASTVITLNVSSHDHDNGDESGEEIESEDSLPLWVPVIFKGDLAQIAASHIKENDRVLVSGQLSPSLPHLNDKKVQASVQVMAHDINFIEKSVQKKTGLPIAKMESNREKPNLLGSAITSKDSAFDHWKDLIDNPDEWYDNRDSKKDRKLSPKFPDFKRKDGSQVLWLSGAPKKLLQEIRGLMFNAQMKTTKEVTQFDDGGDSWEDLANNTSEWTDFRKSKIDGKVNPKHPDFKRKDKTGEALWLNRAPLWFMSKLEGLEFDGVRVQNSNKVQNLNKVEKSKGAIDSHEPEISDDDPWKDLVANPDQWWDNREGKFNIKSPDFKHKKTGEVLWLNKAPTWVSSKLPSPKATGYAPKWKK